MDIKLQFAERFNSALRKNKLDKLTNVEIGKKLGVSGPMISNYTTGKKLPKMEQAISMSMHLGVNVEWLLTGGELENEKNSDKKILDLSKINDTIKYFPLISWVDIDKWSCNAMDKGIDALEVKQTVLPVSDHCFWLEVISENMSPIFAKGDRVLIDPKITPKNNQFILVNLNGSEYTIRQLVVDGGALYAKSTNHDWPSKLEVISGISKIKGTVVEKSVNFMGI